MAYVEIIDNGSMDGTTITNSNTLTIASNAVIGDLQLILVGSWGIGKDTNSVIEGRMTVLFTVATIVNPDDIAIEITPTIEETININVP